MEHLNPFYEYAKIKGLDGIRSIVLRYRETILVEVSYADNIPAVDGILTNSLDEEGNGLIQVGVNLIEKLYTEEDARATMEAEYADSIIMMHAIG